MEFDEKMALLGPEIDRIMKEVLMDASPLERAVVVKGVQELALIMSGLNRGYPAKIWRMILEVSYRYHLLCEGLEKK